MNNPFLLLQSITKQDSLDIVFPLLEDLQLVSVVSAWSKIKVVWEPPDLITEVPMSDHDLWDLLWEFSVWDFEELSLAAAVTDSTALRCFNRARLFRLIYPDGNISNSARRVLTLIIGAFLGDMSGKASSLNPGQKEKKKVFDGEA